MPIQILQALSSKGESVISPDELKSRYFFGIPIIDSQGNPMPDSTIIDFINFATLELEGYLNLKLSKEIIKEVLNFTAQDWRAWGFIPTTYPVLEVYSLEGKIGTIEKQIEFPKEWLSVKRSTDPFAAQRRVHVIPTIGSVTGNTVAFSGISAQLGWFTMSVIPDYWVLEYCTSFKKVPGDIVDAVGKLAAINIFNNLGDIILGAGIASQSIGIDGLSQSISTTSSATNSGYGARIGQYEGELKLKLPQLKNKYMGIVLGVL